MIKKKGERIRHKFSGSFTKTQLFCISLVFFFFSGFNFDLLD